MTEKFIKKQLQQQLEEMGIGSRDTVAIHTSLRAVGPVEGGAEAFLEAFTEYLSEGLLVVPTHTWANVGPDHPVYDVRKTMPCVGIVPQIAAFHPRGVRSMHATHSVAVFGRRAEEYAAYDLEAHTPTPEEGCFGRLYEEKAKILLIGVGQERNTFLHVSEEIAQVPQRLTAEPIPIRMIDREGRETVRSFYKHYNPVCAHISENFVKFDRPFARCGAVWEGALGNARVLICDAVKCQDETLRLWSLTEEDLTVDQRSIPEDWY